MSHYDSEKEKAEKREALYQQILHELQSDERLKEAFKEYSESSVESFYRDCASDKVRVLEWGPKHIEWQEKAQEKWERKVYMMFAQIQHKKLFDLQCQWRAEQVQIEGICIGADFLRYEMDIFNCPLIEPVSPEDIELYRLFTESPEYTGRLHFLQSWQDYNRIAGGLSDSQLGCFPEWYDFHNIRTGKGFYLQLPDIRGEKEHRYLVLAANENQAAYKQQETKNLQQETKNEQQTGNKKAPAKKGGPATSNKIDTRPALNHHTDDFIKRFVKNYEDDETKKYYWKYMSFIGKDEGDRYNNATEIIKELSEDMEVFPMEANDDWYPALNETLFKYNLVKTNDAINTIYEQYLLYVNGGIQFPSEHNDMFIGMAEDSRKRILRGRVLAGEPENFDF